MRTVISHFFNEEYLLPWWLEHHVKLFDHGLLIDHGSTDSSADICRQIAPHWRLVKSRLTHFDAWLNDFEVMTQELNVDGWKIALTTTEFLVSNPGLDEIERFLQSEKRSGIAASGMSMIDKQPTQSPNPDIPLVLQKPWAVDDNRFAYQWIRRVCGYPTTPHRNRFYHTLPNGMYHVGRHASLHPDWRVRLPNLMVLHYSYAPWTERFIARKMQIASKIPESDKARGWGSQHLLTLSELQRNFEMMNGLPFIDLRHHELGAAAIGIAGLRSEATICPVRNRV